MKLYLQLFELAMKHLEDLKELAESNQARRNVLSQNVRVDRLWRPNLPSVAEDPGDGSGAKQGPGLGSEGANSGAGEGEDTLGELEDSVDLSVTDSDDLTLASERMSEEQQARIGPRQRGPKPDCPPAQTKLEKRRSIASWVDSLDGLIGTKEPPHDECGSGLLSDAGSEAAPAVYDDTMGR